MQQVRKKHRTGETFADLAQLYLERHAKVQKRSWREDERKLAWKEFEASLEAALSEDVEVAELIRNRGRRVGPQSKPTGRLPVKVRVTNDESDFYTIVDVTANDRIGLLLVDVVAEQDSKINELEKRLARLEALLLQDDAAVSTGNAR